MPSILTNVMATATIKDRIAAFPTVFRMLSISPAPNFCAVSTVKPAVSPRRKPKIRKLIVPVAPTAANAFVPTNFPTITVSAME